MTINRRDFIQWSMLLAATPAFAPLLPLSSEARSYASPAVLAEPSVNGKGADGKVTFAVDGWDYDRLKGTIDDEISIRINQAWRAAWR